MLIPELAKHVDLDAIGDPSSLVPRPSSLYFLGNNPHHAWIYDEAMRTPGVIVLHDLVLHHLIVEMTLARGDVDGYVAALEANHGEAGAAWARGRAAGLHSEMGNFLLPASVDVANRSRAVIVHNRYAAERLQSFGVTAPIHVVPHPFEPQPSARGRRDAVRAQHGFAADDRVIGLFGFLTSAKRAEVVLEAFADARGRDPKLRLLIVGEPAPNVDVDALRGDGITFTGYVPDEEFAAYFAAVDRLVNLRYPSAGETSGTLIRAFEAGKPVAVSDYAQFAEFPDDCVVKIPFGDREAATLAEFFVCDLDDPSEAQAKWLRENASMELTVRGYLAALDDTSRKSHPPITRTIPLFPKLDAALRGDAIVLHNIGDVTLRTRSYGQPGYRLMMLTFDGDAVIDDRWVELPRDLRPGDSAVVALPRASGTLRLYHAIEGIPMIVPEPFAAGAVVRAAL
ncbi:MAG TPA: glycosyltransferase family 4 protein [Thermoanaerobaculia bacterium]|jgi:glycosyltransferase involved in cell wall biosynthesis|nr:glycosyltransferase family 4 protein [Thermoanaerobaculia bacterium]